MPLRLATSLMVVCCVAAQVQAQRVPTAPIPELPPIQPVDQLPAQAPPLPPADLPPPQPPAQPAPLPDVDLPAPQSHADAPSGTTAAATSTPTVGVNIGWPVYHVAERQFTNLMRQSMVYVGDDIEPWISNRNGWGDGPRLNFDSDGNVLSLPAGVTAATLCPATLGCPAGPYVATWNGSGQVDLEGGNGASIRVTSTSPQRIDFRLSTSQDGYLVVKVSGGTVSNISITPRREGNLVFPEEYVNLLSRFDVIRFKDALRTDDLPRNTPLAQSSQQSYGPTGWPLEKCSDLCSLTGTRAWLNIPYWANNAYVREFARACEAQNFDTPYIELGNEVWNGIFSDQYAYAAARGTGSGGSTERAVRWYARRSKQVHAIFAANYSKPFVRVVGAQADWPYLSEVMRDAGMAGDALAVGAYVGGSYYNPDDGSPPTTSSINGMFAALNADLITLRDDLLPQQKAIADELGMKLIAYEGGQHLSATFSSAEGSPLIRRAQRDSRMRSVYRNLQTAWRDAGGGLFCHYNLTGPPGDRESFGLLEHSRQKSSVKWNTVVGN